MTNIQQERCQTYSPTPVSRDAQRSAVFVPQDASCLNKGVSSGLGASPWSLVLGYLLVIGIWSLVIPPMALGVGNWSLLQLLLDTYFPPPYCLLAGRITAASELSADIAILRDTLTCPI